MLCKLEFAVIYADDGISGTNTKKREDFNRMIDDCEAGNIDMIITKSISRFARNTLDCLKYIRELKDINIPVIFEKESIAHTIQKADNVAYAAIFLLFYLCHYSDNTIVYLHTFVFLIQQSRMIYFYLMCSQQNIL